jgi:hypothetical protein
MTVGAWAPAAEPERTTAAAEAESRERVTSGKFIMVDEQFEFSF